MNTQDFPIEFKNDVNEDDFDQYIMIEESLRKLSKGHTDITGAAVTLEHPAAGRNTPYIIEASIVVYTRPNYVSATEKHSDPNQALKGALRAVERQVHEQREKLRSHKASADEMFISPLPDENSSNTDETPED